MKNFDIILGLVLPWIIIVFGIPVGTYYITSMLVRCIYILLLIFSAGVLFRLALNAWRNRNK